VENMQRQHIRIMGYGAAAKGMTILNYIGKIPLEYIVDDSPIKQGFYATNHKYLILSPDKLGYHAHPIAVVVFAWNFLPEIMEKIRNIRKGLDTYLIAPYPRKTIYHLSADGKTYKIYEEMDTRYNANSLHHKTILFSHFYNEEILLTQWIRHHASLFDCAVLIDHNSTDNSRKVIQREAPESWNVVSSYLTEFCAQKTDQEVAGYENSFNNTDWRLALTTTEFLFTLGLRRKDNTVFENVNGKRALQIQSLSMIDDTPEVKVQGGTSLLRQKNSVYFTTKPDAEKTKTERYMNGHYNRYMHNIRDFTNPYWLGRHNFRHPAKPTNLHILKCLFSPFPEFFARKAQIRTKIPENNIREGWGFQHLVNMTDLCDQYSDRQQLPLLQMTDVEGNKKYYDKHMRDKTGEDDANVNMMLPGVYMNLYGNTTNWLRYRS
jgi:hypothetical protein